MELREAYSILGVRAWASEVEVRESYCDIEKAWHPSRHQNDARLLRKAEQKLQAAGEALRKIRAAGYPAAEPQRSVDETRHSPHPPAWHREQYAPSPPPPWQGQPYPPPPPPNGYGYAPPPPHVMSSRSGWE